MGSLGAAMNISMLQSKIHRATVTDADLHYHGSITIDRELMDRADLLPHQQVHVYNITNGARFETYVIEGPRDSGCIKINGAAAHLASTGHLVIIVAYCDMSRESAVSWRPRVIFVDDQNRPLAGDLEAAG
jgi:aspartate 1-decarboxylase